MTDVRVALVGYGSAGQGIHAPLLSAAGAPPSLVVTANPERAAAVAADLPSATVVPSLDDALAARPDLVVLASPTGAHVVNALACIAAGVPTVVDKPLAVDGPSAASVVAQARAGSVPLTVFQNRRWDAEQLTLRSLLAAGDLGEVHRFERRWERWRPVPKERWRENAPWQEGGGLLLDLGPHLVDSAVQLFGPVAAVYAEVRAWTTPSEDEIFLALRHASGTASHVTASSVAAAPGPRTRVLGSAAAYVTGRFESDPAAFDLGDPVGCTGFLFRGEERSPVPTAPGTHVDFYRAVLAAISLSGNGFEAVQAAMPVDPADAVHTARVLDAARRSGELGEVVAVGSGVTGEAPFA